MDDPTLTDALTTALRPWLVQALAFVKMQPPELMAEVRKCMDGDGEIRAVYHVRGNFFTIEAVAPDAEGKITITEVYREVLVPYDGGFAMPDTDTRQ
jgi:hypothetical protein